MTAIEQIKKKIESTKELKSIVRVMKSLAASNIRQCEKAATATDEYRTTIELGLQAILQFGKKKIEIKKPTLSSTFSSGLIIFGSDLGLCGQFNADIAHFALPHIKELKEKSEKLKLLFFGDYIEKYLAEELGDKLLYSPSFEGIPEIIQELLLKMHNWILQENVSQIFLLFMKPIKARFHPYLKKLLPFDAAFFKEFKNQKWPNRQIPLFTIDEDLLLHSFLEEYLFIAVYEAIVDSLTSEYTYRLRAMSDAEKNIDSFLSDLHQLYSHTWQEVVTEEILDIETGFESLKKKK